MSQQMLVALLTASYVPECYGCSCMSQGASFSNSSISLNHMDGESKWLDDRVTSTFGVVLARKADLL